MQDRRSGQSDHDCYDVIMVGTFAAWRLGTLQARALPFARALQAHGIRCAVVTVPWDLPSERGVIDVRSTVPLFNTNAAALIKLPLALGQLRRFVTLHRPSVLHVFKPRGYGGFLASLASSVPTVIDVDDWEGDGGWNRSGQYNLVQRRLFDWQERDLVASATGVTAASTLLAERARSARKCQPADHVWHVPNGLTRDWFTRLRDARAARSHATPEHPRILLYSRFAEFGHDWLPRFVAALNRCSQNPVTLTVIGATDDPPPVLDSGHMELDLMGYVARDRLPEALATATLAVYPYRDSLINRSKNSVKLLELMAAGCAVLASDVGEISPVLGDAGVVIQGHEPEMFAAYASRLLQRDRLLCDMSRLAQKRVESGFVVDGLAPSLVEAYETVGRH
jgi:glycosyltransferase involved in cell wall biosynthesis